ncbi:MAG TPA: tetratricopeptide repeat protein [Herpetosiphonaceae bacterium]
MDSSISAGSTADSSATNSNPRATQLQDVVPARPTPSSPGSPLDTAPDPPTPVIQNTPPTSSSDHQPINDETGTVRAHAMPLSSAHTNAPDSEMAELHETVQLLRDQVDALQIQVSKPQRWFSDATTLIALGALLFSLVTTFFSYWQAQIQEIDDSRTELRTIISRMSQIPRDYLVYTQTLTDANTVVELNGSLQAENAMLAARAYEISKDIPDYLTPSEYHLLAQSLFLSNQVERSLEINEFTIAKASGVNDLVPALQGKASILMLMGDVNGGRAIFQTALDVFQRYPTPIKFYELTTHFSTHMDWANAEFTIGQCAEGLKHLEEAHALLSQMQPASAAELQRKQLADYISNASKCVPKP